MRSDTIAADQSRQAVSVFGKVFNRDDYTMLLARYPALIFFTVFMGFLFTVIGLATLGDDDSLLPPNRFDAVNTLAAKLEARAREADVYAADNLQYIDPVAANAVLHPVLLRGHPAERLTLVFKINWERAAAAGVIPQERHFFAHHTVRYVAVLERRLISVLSWRYACWETNLHRAKEGASIGSCAPPNSITQYFFPGERQTDLGTGENYFPYQGAAGLAASGSAPVVQPNVKGIIERIFKNRRWQWYFDKTFTKSNRTAPQVIKSQLVMGATRKWPASDADSFGTPRSALDNSKNIDQALRDMYAILEREKLAQGKALLPLWIDLYFHNERLERLLIHDELDQATWRIVVCVMLCVAIIWIKTKSFTLAGFGTAQVWFTYALVSAIASRQNASTESVLSILYLFAVAALSLNGLFVYIDTFNHSGVMITHGSTNTLSVEQRISWTFRKVMRGAMVSHLVVIIVSALLASLSPVPAVSDSGAIGIIMALVDLLFWLTYTPTLLLFHHFYLSKRRRLLQRRRDVIWERGSNNRDTALMAVLDAVQLSRDLRGEVVPTAAEDPAELGVRINSSPFGGLVAQLKSAYKQLRGEVRGLAQMRADGTADLGALTNRPPGGGLGETEEEEELEQQQQQQEQEEEGRETDNSPSGFHLREQQRRQARSVEKNDNTASAGGSDNNNPPMRHPLAPPRNFSSSDFVESDQEMSVRSSREISAAASADAETENGDAQQQHQRQQQRGNSPNHHGADCADADVMSPAEGCGSDVDAAAGTPSAATPQEEQHQANAGTPRLFSKRRKFPKSNDEVDVADADAVNERSISPSSSSSSSSSTHGNNRSSISREEENNGDVVAATAVVVSDSGAPAARTAASAASGAADDGDLELEEVVVTNADHDEEARRQEEQRLKDFSDVRGLGTMPVAKTQQEKDEEEQNGATSLQVAASPEEQFLAAAATMSQPSSSNETTPTAAASSYSSGTSFGGPRGRKRIIIKAKTDQEEGEKADKDDDGFVFGSNNSPDLRRRGGDFFSGLDSSFSSSTVPVREDAFRTTVPLATGTTKLGAEEDDINRFKITDTAAYLEQFDEAPDAATGGSRAEFFHARRMVAPKHILHVPPPLCYRSGPSRQQVVRLLAHGMGVDDEDEMSGLDPQETPLVPPMFLPLTDKPSSRPQAKAAAARRKKARRNHTSAAAAVHGGGEDHQGGDVPGPRPLTAQEQAEQQQQQEEEEQQEYELELQLQEEDELWMREQIGEACLEAKTFLCKWSHAASRLGISSSDNLKHRREREKQHYSPSANVPPPSPPASGLLLPPPPEEQEPNAVQRAVVALLAVHHQCLQPAGCSCTEFVYNAPLSRKRELQMAAAEIARRGLRRSSTEAAQSHRAMWEAADDDGNRRVIPASVGEDERENRNGTAMTAVAPTFVPMEAVPPSPTTEAAAAAAAAAPSSPTAASMFKYPSNTFSGSVPLPFDDPAAIPAAVMTHQVMMLHPHTAATASGTGSNVPDSVRKHQERVLVADEAPFLCCNGNDLDDCGASALAFAHKWINRIKLKGPPRKFIFCGPRVQESREDRRRRLMAKSKHIQLSTGLMETYLLRYFDAIVLPQRLGIAIAFTVVFVLSIVGTASLTGTSARFQHLDGFTHNADFLAVAHRGLTALYQDETVLCDTCGAYFRDNSADIFNSDRVPSDVVAACGLTHPKYFANLYVDRCGVCMGNNSCVDCAGTPFGNRSVDKCGQCLLRNDTALRDACTSPAAAANRSDYCRTNPTSCSYCEAEFGPAFRGMGGANCDVFCDEKINCFHGRCNRYTGECDCFSNGTTFNFPLVDLEEDNNEDGSSSSSSGGNENVVVASDGTRMPIVPLRRLGGYFSNSFSPSCLRCAGGFAPDVAYSSTENTNELAGVCYQPCWPIGSGSYSRSEACTMKECSDVDTIELRGGRDCAVRLADLCFNGKWQAPSRKCECSAGWTGKSCDKETACSGRGVRLDRAARSKANISGAIPSGLDVCLCDGQWTGGACQLCACRNGGYCDSDIGGRCRCVGAWAGTDCSECAATCAARGLACPEPWEPKHYPQEPAIGNVSTDSFSSAKYGSCQAVFCTELERLGGDACAGVGGGAACTGTCAACRGISSTELLTAVPSTKCVGPCSGHWGGAACDVCGGHESMRCVSDGTDRIQACDGNYYFSSSSAPREDSCGVCTRSNVLTRQQFQLALDGVSPFSLTGGDVAARGEMMDLCESQTPAPSPNDDTDIFLYVGVIHPVRPLQSWARPDNAGSSFAVRKFGTKSGALDLSFNASDPRTQLGLATLCQQLRGHQVGRNVFSFLTENCSVVDLLWWMAGTAPAARRGLPPLNSSADRHAIEFIIDTQTVQGQLGMMINPDRADTLKFPRRSEEDSPTREYDRRVAFTRIRLALPASLVRRDAERYEGAPSESEEILYFETLTGSIERVLNISAIFVSRRWTELQQENQGPRTLGWILICGLVAVFCLTNIAQRSFLAALITVLSVAGVAFCSFAVIRAERHALGSIEIFLMPALFAIACSHSLHFMDAYQEVLSTSQSNLFATELSRAPATKEALARSGPALITSSVIMLLCCAVFSTSKLIPLSLAAKFCALAILISAFVAVVALPALLCLMGPETYYPPRLSLVLVMVYAVVMMGLLLSIAGAGGIMTPLGSPAPTF